MRLPKLKLTPGAYKFNVAYYAPVNRGATVLKSTRPSRFASVCLVEGQYVAYRFFRVDPAWRRLSVEERAAGKDAFAEVVEGWAERFETLRAYTVSGVRPECDFFLWQITSHIRTSASSAPS